jgi:hypothetical protein
MVTIIHPCVRDVMRCDAMRPKAGTNGEFQRPRFRTSPSTWSLSVSAGVGGWHEVGWYVGRVLLVFQRGRVLSALGTDEQRTFTAARPKTKDT